jgi:phenylacetaldehyde dehydrogenase
MASGAMLSRKRRLDVFDPSSAECIATIAAGDAQDVNLAVEAAHRSMADGRWSRCLAGTPRADPVEVRRAHRIRYVEELAVLESVDNGKPLSAARDIDLPDAVRFARYMAGWATKIDGRVVPLSAPNAPLGMTFREPVGVVGAIIPWNFPFNMAVQKVFPALAAGCSAVLKPAEQTSLTAIRLGELAQAAGVPDGVLNVTAQAWRSALNASMAAWSSMRLFVVAGTPPLNSRFCSPQVSTAAQPPGPGLP